MRTSISHPLQIAEVRAGPGYGLVGLTFCPGKQQPAAMSGGWSRDLDLDLDAVAAWNAAAVVTLLEPHELVRLKVQALGAMVRTRHMAWHHLPIRDVDVPGAGFEAVWAEVGPKLRARLRDGANVLVHCKGGLGRAGMIAARLLIELGMESQEAIAAVRKVRPGAIETRSQLDRVRSWGVVPEAAPDMDAEAVRDRAVGALLGLALGDALGSTRDGAPRDSTLPVAGLAGDGRYNLAAGQWTAPTTMAVALATSLIERRSFDEADFLERLAWWEADGEFSCTGTCIGMSASVAGALARFRGMGELLADPADRSDADGAALVRLPPVAIRYWQSGGADGPLRDVAVRQSRTTNADPASLATATLFAELLGAAIAGSPRALLLREQPMGSEPALGPLASGAWRHKHRHEIRSAGDPLSLLEAALWCIARTGDFAEAVLLAANLSEAASATAAVTGQLAGALYGKAGIPKAWLSQLAWSELLESLALELTTPWGWYPEQSTAPA